jgi:hypothetical protein
MEEFLDHLSDQIFLRRSGVTFHFTFPHTCSTQLNSYPLLCMACRCVIFFFRDMSLFLMTGETGFGPTRDVISSGFVEVTVSLVTAVTNWSEMVLELLLRLPCLN